MGDILLPPGRTVMQLTEEALVRAFRQSGYRVVKAGDADYGRAIPVTVAVQEFWAWGTPGALTFKLEFKSSVRISAPVGPFGNGETVTSYAKEGYVAATSSSWLETVNLGLEDLVNNVKAKLKKS
jgi:uncharacterized lipoprotein YajG